MFHTSIYQKEPKLTYAKNASGQMVSILNVEKGLACNCRCPKCNEKLVAKIGKGGRQPHFAHQNDSDCQGSYMSALHIMSEQIIMENMSVMAPTYKSVSGKSLRFTKVEVEKRVDRKDLQPDIVGETEDGLRWVIEIKNTHEVDEEKKRKIRQSNITCLEIDVSKQTLENLKSFLLESTDSREWINNPNYEQLYPEIQEENFPTVNHKNSIAKKLEKSIDEYLKDNNYKVLPLKECQSLCEYRPFGGNCIYKEGVDKYNNDLYVVCNKKKFLKDKIEVTTDLGRPLKNSNIEEEPPIYQPLSTIIRQNHNWPPKREENVSAPIPVPSQYALPFDRFWTIDEYFSQLMSTRLYEKDTGHSTEIIDCNRTNNKIILVYKDIIGLYSHHIDIITVKNGGLIKNTVADFVNEGFALSSYSTRLREMKRFSIHTPSFPNDDPPF